MDTKVLPQTDVARTAIETHPGLDPEKQENEDVAVCAATPHGLLCLVCDGMGGHENGRLAATTAANEIVSRLIHGAAEDAPGRALAKAVQEANAKVFALSRNKRLHAGATCVAILVHDHGTEVAHAGDSRAYLVHRGTIAQVTRDHSKVRDMVDRGLLTPEEARVHPEANQITRALGIAEQVDVELRSSPLPHMSGDVYVLCTDGLSDLVTPDEIMNVVMQADDEPRAAKRLVELALERGGHDNTTVIVARIQRDAVVSSSMQTAIGTPPPPQVTEPTRAVPTTERPPPVAATVRAEPPRPRTPVPSSGWEEGAEQPRAGRGKATLAIGLVLALVAVGILVALYIVLERRHHRVQGPIPHALPTLSPSSAAPSDSLHPLQQE